MDVSDEENDGSEALIVDSRRMIRRGGVRFSSDISEPADYDKMSPLFEITWRKAGQLNMLAVGRNDKLTGQAGLVDFGDGNLSIVTALHNIAERNFSRPFAAALKQPGPTFDKSFQTNFPDMGKKDLSGMVITGSGQVQGTGFWEYGTDVAIGTLHGVEDASMEQLPAFEAIPRKNPAHYVS